MEWVIMPFRQAAKEKKKMDLLSLRLCFFSPNLGNQGKVKCSANPHYTVALDHLASSFPVSVNVSLDAKAIWYTLYASRHRACCSCSCTLWHACLLLWHLLSSLCFCTNAYHCHCLCYTPSWKEDLKTWKYFWLYRACVQVSRKSEGPSD